MILLIKVKSIITTGLVFVFFNINAQNINLINNIPGREKMSLNGKWEYIVDPFEAGFLDYRDQQYDEYPDQEKLEGIAIYTNPVQQFKDQRLEIQFTQRDELRVPGDWNSQKERLDLYEGTIWYKKEFDYNLTKDKRLFVYFGGINYESHVYLNGKKLGTHLGGFTPFNFEVTGLVKGTGNHLVIRVNNERKKSAIPPKINGWWNFGGITRDVYLVETPRVFIQDYFIYLSKDNPNTIEGWFKLNNQDESMLVSLSIPELNINKKVNVDEGKATFKIDGINELEKWHPDNPRMYDVIMGTPHEEIIDRIAFRTVETRGREILLNGKPIFLRGVCMHEEIPMREGRAYSEEDAKLLLEWADDLNCNFLRLTHYPYNENFVRLADKMGFLVWSEIPVFWMIDANNEETYQAAESQLTEMINRDKNRASVIFWSLSNELPAGEDMVWFVKRLHLKTKELDPTRLTTASTNRTTSVENKLVINDPLFDFLDVIGLNEYLSWYDNTVPETMKNITITSNEKKPIIISEFGGGVYYNFHADSLTRWSEEFVTRIYRNQFKMFDNNKKTVQGTCPWLLTDYRYPRALNPYYQRKWNRKGLISEGGHKKDIYYLLRNYYKEGGN